MEHNNKSESEDEVVGTVMWCSRRPALAFSEPVYVTLILSEAKYS